MPNQAILHRNQRCLFNCVQKYKMSKAPEPVPQRHTVNNQELRKPKSRSRGKLTASEWESIIVQEPTQCPQSKLSIHSENNLMPWAQPNEQPGAAGSFLELPANKLSSCALYRGVLGAHPGNRGLASWTLTVVSVLFFLPGNTLHNVFVNVLFFVYCAVSKEEAALLVALPYGEWKRSRGHLCLKL